MLIALLTSCISQKDVYFFTSFHEPANEGLRMLYSYDGYNWEDLDTKLLKPEAGTQKVMRDPSIVQGPDGTFHLVWTSSWKGDYGFGYASSKDLVHWSKQQHIEVMSYDTSTVNVWAPELFYDEATRQFFIIWASTVPYKFDKGIEDEFNNHRLYYVTTKDFKKYSETRLFYDPGYSSIDATLVNRGKEDYVLVFKDNTRPERNIKVAFGKSAIGPFERQSKPFTASFTEGPSVVKVGEDWLIYFDSYRESKYSAVKTKDFQIFEDVSDKISVPKGHKHGTIFKANDMVLRKIKKELITMKTKLNEYLNDGIVDVLSKKKRTLEDSSGEYFLITWHESGDETHFMLMDMIHYDFVEKSIGKLVRQENPKDKKWSDIIKNKQDFIDRFLSFCHENQLLLKGRNTAFWIQTYCDDPWPFDGYNILRIISIPEFGD